MPNLFRLVPLLVSFWMLTPTFLWAETTLGPPRQLQVFDTESKERGVAERHVQLPGIELRQAGDDDAGRGALSRDRAADFDEEDLVSQTTKRLDHFLHGVRLL